MWILHIEGHSPNSESNCALWITLSKSGEDFMHYVKNMFSVKWILLLLIKTFSVSPSILCPLISVGILFAFKQNMQHYKKFKERKVTALRQTTFWHFNSFYNCVGLFPDADCGTHHECICSQVHCAGKTGFWYNLAPRRLAGIPLGRIY